jgi:hypothetical protein
LFFACDGWGAECFFIDYGTVTIRAWTSVVIVSEHHAHFNGTVDDNDLVIKSDPIVDLDKNINLVQVIISVYQ